MADWRGWLGLGTDEDEDDPVKKTLDYLGSFGEAATEAASGVGSAIGSAASSLVAPPTAPSPFGPAGTPGVYVEPEEDRQARGQYITDTLGQAAAAGWEGLEPTRAAPRPAPSWEDPLASVRSDVERIQEDPASLLPAVRYGRVQGPAANVIGRRSGAAAGLSAEDTMTVPESVPFLGGTPFSQQDVAGLAGEAVLDPLNFVGVPGAVHGGQSVAGAVARALPGVGEVEAVGRGGAGLARRAAGGIADMLPGSAAADDGAQLLGGGLIPQGVGVRGLWQQANGALEALGARLSAADDAVQAAERSGMPDQIRAADAAYGRIRREHDAAAQAVEALRPGVQRFDDTLEAAGLGRNADEVGLADTGAAVPGDTRVRGPVSPFVDTSPREISLGSGVVPDAPQGRPGPRARGAGASRYADELAAAGTPESSVDKWRSLAAADVGGPEQLARRLQTVPLVTTEDARALLGDRPEYLEPVIGFLASQRRKLLDGGMTARDVAKAYGQTLMSMRSSAQQADGTMAKMANGFTMNSGEVVPPNPQLGALDDLVNPRTGEPLGPIFTETNPRTGGRIVRPESAGSAWFWTDEGQRALDAMEQGTFDPGAWDGLQRTRKAFGSDTIGGNGALRPLTAAEQRAGMVNMTNLPAFVDEMNQGIAQFRAAGRDAEIGPWLGEQVQRLNGISTGKQAFIKQLIGMGDAPTIDAREINYWLSGRGLPTQAHQDPGTQLARATSQWWTNRPVREAMAGRIQGAFTDLKQRYPELLEGVDDADAGEILHHWLWDRAGGSETRHTDLMLTQRLAAGLAPAAEPGQGAFSGLRAGAYNAAQGGVMGAASESLEAGAEGREGDPAETARRALIGGVLGVGAGVAARRGGGRALGSGVVPQPSARISPLGQRVHDTYAAVTPERAERATQRTVQIASDAIAARIPRSGGMQQSPTQLVQDVHAAIVANLADTKIVATGIRPDALQAYFRGEGLTSKVDTGDLGKINEITQGQVNVAGGRAGKPYTIDEAADFAQRESEQMRVATGGTRFPDPETGAVDEAAPRVMYAYVSEGQPLVGPNRPTAWLVWDDDTPRITSAHHPYGLTSPGQDIHANMPPGLKAAIWNEHAIAGGRHGPAVMEGGRLVEAAPGVQGTSPMTFGWEGSGLDVGDGRKIAQTDWLVGPEGEDAMRANGLILGMPQTMQRAIAGGSMTDPQQIAAVLMRGGSPKWKGGWGAVMNPSRSESLVLDPDITKIKAIYLTGRPKDLATPIRGGGKAGARPTELEAARKIRADVLAQTNGEKDIPILFNDISTSAPSASQQAAGASLAGWSPRLISDAQLLEGPPMTLSPGRAAIRDQYTAAGLSDIGAGMVPGQGSGLRSAAYNAAQGGVMGAASESLEAGAEGREADPAEMGRRALIGGALGVGAGVAARRGGAAEAARALGSGVVPRSVDPDDIANLARRGAEARGERIPGLPEGAQPIRATAAQEVSRLRLDLFPPQVRDDIAAAAGGADYAHTQRRGVLGDEAVADLAADDERSVDQLIKGGKLGRAYNPEETVALRNAVASQANVVRDLSQEIAEATASGATPDLLIARRAAESTKLQALVQVAEGARAEAGRTLRQYAQQAKLIEMNPDQAIARIRAKIADPDEFTAIVDEYTQAVNDGADPIVMAKLWSKVERGEIKAGDIFALYRRFNMLSGPRTFEVNALSGGLNLGYEMLGQAAGQGVRGRLGEAAAELGAPFKAGARAFQNMAETMWHGVTAEQAARGDIPRNLSARTDNPVAKAALTAMEIPDRLNAGVDQFFRTMTEDWAATILAHKQARADGLTPRSADWAETVAQKLEAIREDVSAFPEVKAMADRVTFSEEPGGIVKGLEDLKRRSPNLVGFVAPFIRTPANIASRAVDISPLGPVRTAVEAATGLGRGRANLSTRVRDNVIGTAATTWAYTKAQQGELTGAGPDDPEKQAMLRRTGWQPYSIKIGDQYWSYANFAPFSLALSAGAAAAEAQKYAKPGKEDVVSMLADGAARTGKVVTDMTVLAGLGAVIKAQQDPDRYGTQWLTTALTQLMPAGSFVNTVGQWTDPLVRRSERTDVGTQVSQNLQARVPWLRETVPAAQDPLGRDIESEQTGWRALNPFRPTTERDEPVLRTFLDAGVDIGKPRQDLTISAHDANGRVTESIAMPLTAAEQREWNRLRGEALSHMLEGASQDPSFASRPAAVKEKYLRDKLEAANDYATRTTRAQIGGEAISRRVAPLRRAG